MITCRLPRPEPWILLIFPGFPGRRTPTRSETLNQMSLDKATVANIARLARIRVSEAEQESLAGELSQILSWIEQLNEVDTTGVEPMTRVGNMKLKKRNDEVTDGNCRDAILANAPETRDGLFAVPKVVE